MIERMLTNTLMVLGVVMLILVMNFRFRKHSRALVWAEGITAIIGTLLAIGFRWIRLFSADGCPNFPAVMAGTLVLCAGAIFIIFAEKIGTAGNFSVSIGKAKSKKTFNVSAIVAAALIGETVLGYDVKLPKDKPLVLYFDTEQSQSHCVKVLKRINRLCGKPVDDLCPQLYFHGLRKYTPEDRLDCISMALEQHKGLVGLVIIDGIRDCLYDINSPTEATMIVGHLLAWTDIYKCHIHTILHQNKSDENARGHIGTELNNKAETVIKVEKSKDDPKISVVTPIMCRDKEFAPFAFFIDDDGLPKLDSEYSLNATSQSGRKAFDPWADIPKTCHAQCLERLFPNGEGSYSSSELVEAMLSLHSPLKALP